MCHHVLPCLYCEGGSVSEEKWRRNDVNFLRGRWAFEVQNNKQDITEQICPAICSELNPLGRTKNGNKETTEVSVLVYSPFLQNPNLLIRRRLLDCILFMQ